MDKRYIAEAIGTFVLTLAVGLSDGALLATPIVAAIVLGLMVYVIGWLSGCHLNPAVSLGLYGVGKLKTTDLMWYVLSQLAGAAVAMFLLIGNRVVPLEITNVTPLQMGYELLGMVVFCMSIGMVVYSKVPSSLSGIVVGAGLLVGLVLAISGGAVGLFNPAVALGLRVTFLGYYVIDVLGGVVGFRLAHYLTE